MSVDSGQWSVAESDLIKPTTTDLLTTDLPLDNGPTVNDGPLTTDY